MNLPFKVTGVYEIKCGGPKRYIGSSGRCIGNRISHHRATLRSGNHYNKSLQAAYNEHGEAAFSVRYWSMPPKDALEAEQKKLDYWMARGLAHNKHPVVTSSKGHKWTEASKKNGSEKALARCTPEWRAAVSARVKAQHAAKKFGSATWSEEARRSIAEKAKGRPNKMKGKKMPPEHGAKVSAALKGKPKTPEHILAAAHPNKMKGKKMPPEHGQKISAALKGKAKTPEHIRAAVEGRTRAHNERYRKAKESQCAASK